MGRRFTGSNPLLRMVPVLLAAAVAAVVVAVTRDGGSDSTSPSTSTVAVPTPNPSTTAVSTTDAETTAVTITERETAAVSTTDAERSLFEEDGVFRWLWVEPDTIRFVWRDGDDVPFGQMQLARAWLESAGEHVVAITNGGIHRPDLVPSGLYVENGVELRPLNRASGSGNFFLQPNGVFWIDGGRAAVETTDSYASADRTVDGAVQSGPMLVIDSAINPAFSESSTSTHRRNAVGVDDEGRVLLILADRAVTLWAMAERCRELGAIDALYLDGTLSRLDAVTDGRPVFPNLPVASMIAVVED